ncbi:MAG: hypothetical protein GX541_05005 [Clostridiales bacterium]|jgi:formylmethanofuran dehydrogenase subunit E|nr:hypothetical protein [Clostridiales bacterium]
MDIMEKAAYLNGLAEGLDISSDTKEGKLLRAMVEVINELAASVNDLQNENNEINSELDEIAEQLIDIEDALEMYDEYDEDTDFYEVECPACGERLSVDEDIMEQGRIKCPGCGEDLEFEFDEAECDDPECKCHS